MFIAHNLGAMNAQRQYNIVTNRKTKLSEKLSSGYRINRAADDAAGLSISEKMRRQIRGLTQGVENTQDGVSLCQVADGALAEVNDMLHRITELSVKSANGTNSEQDRQYIQEEISQILQEIDRIGDTTTFNERKVFKGDSVSNITGGNSAVKSEITISVSGQSSDGLPKTYNISADVNTGVSIDNENYTWQEFVNSAGNTLADGTLQNGKYVLSHHGMDVSIELFNKNLDEVAIALNGLSWATEVQTSTNVQTSAVSNVVPDIFEMTMPAWTSLNKIHILANESGLGVSYEGGTEDALYWDYNYGSQITSSWAAMGIDINNIVEGTYTYSDSRTGLKYQFKVESGATKESLINSLNNVVMTIDNTVESERTYQAPVSKYGDIPPYDFEDYETCYLATYFNPTRDSMANFAETDINSEMYSSDSTDSKYIYTLTDDGKLGNSGNGQTVDKVLSLWIQSGCEAGDGMWLEIDNMNTSILGIEDVDVSTVSGANQAMDAVKGALQKVTANRSKIGAQQNRLEHTIANEENIVENTTAAESRIRDTDMAKTMVEYSNTNILLQAGQAMMAQANQSNQGVLSLLQ